MLQAGEMSPLRVRVHVLAHHHGHRRGQAPSHLQANLLPGGSVRRRPPRGDTLTADRVRLGHADLCGHPPGLHHILSAPHHQDQDTTFQHNHGRIHITTTTFTNTGSLKIMVGKKLHLRAIKRLQIKF